MAFIKQRVAMSPFNYLLFSSTLAGLLTSVAWMLVTWAVEGLPGKTVIDGKTITQPLKKQMLERFLMGFFGGFSVNLIMHMVAEEPIPQTLEVQRELKEAAYRNAHPCGGAVAPSPCAMAAAAPMSSCPLRPVA